MKCLFQFPYQSLWIRIASDPLDEIYSRTEKVFQPQKMLSETGRTVSCKTCDFLERTSTSSDSSANPTQNSIARELCPVCPSHSVEYFPPQDKAREVGSSGGPDKLTQSERRALSNSNVPFSARKLLDDRIINSNI
jgi:hypothetical protein